MELIREQIEEEKEENLVVDGDFNARTGNKGGPVREENGKVKETRDSIDKVVNREGRILVSKIEERGWMILNRSYNRGGRTYIGERGASVVDYVIVNEKAEENIKMIVGDRTESDHVPLEVELKWPETNVIKQERATKIIERSNLMEEGIRNYQEKCKRWTNTQIENKSMWKELKEKIRSSTTKTRKEIMLWRLGKREWHSKEWKREKRYLRKMLRKLKKDKISREEYVRKRKYYKI
ncbi:hypothetical protein RF55_11351 [Lasius niger]|uniref:Endonuclease/exonuclease/phosphatase domain-containing protein n=1 Tax=Lasius niger TaxID=67767 RepID=A0A0J7KF73_LASNI|nr:hypothetical protein RF55_11351 [Lasius niger]